MELHVEHRRIFPATVLQAIALFFSLRRRRREKQTDESTVDGLTSERATERERERETGREGWNLWGGLDLRRTHFDLIR